MNPSTYNDLVRSVREGFVPLVSKAPGYVSYSFFKSGEDTLVTISTFQDRNGADESNKLAATFIRDKLSNFGLSAPEILSGETSVHHISGTEGGRGPTLRQ
jgi:hypothetical protein